MNRIKKLYCDFKLYRRLCSNAFFGLFQRTFYKGWDDLLNKIMEEGILLDTNTFHARTILSGLQLNWDTIPFAAGWV